MRACPRRLYTWISDIYQEGGALRLVSIIAGFALLVTGIVGLILPIMPGWVMVIPGLALLAREFHWARRTLDWLKQRLEKKPTAPR